MQRLDNPSAIFNIAELTGSIVTKRRAVFENSSSLPANAAGDMPV